MDRSGWNGPRGLKWTDLDRMDQMNRSGLEGPSWTVVDCID